MTSMSAAELEQEMNKTLYPFKDAHNAVTAEEKKQDPDAAYRKQHITITGPGEEKNDLYYEEYGNPEGEPVFILHGGPGLGTHPSYSQYYDPNFYRIICFDQRNAKRSRPSAAEKGVLKNNTSEQMMEDINRLAEALGVDFSGQDPTKPHKIHLMGGSWGSTLGLYYGAHYPERLHSLALRATWMSQACEVNKLHEYEVGRDGKPTDVPQLKAMVSAEDWPRCEVEWNEFIGFLKKESARLPDQELLKHPTDAYHFLMNDDSVPENVQREAAFRHLMLEHVIGDVEHTPEWVAKNVNDDMTKDEQLAYSRIENNFEVALNKGTPGFYAKAGDPNFNWFTQGKVEKNGKQLDPMAQLAQIPLIRVVHGQKDSICFPYNTDILEKGLTPWIQKRLQGEGKYGVQLKLAFEKALRIERPVESGHMLGDLGISKAMIGFSKEILGIRNEEQALDTTLNAPLHRPFH